MANYPVFTSSSGGDIGAGRLRTNLRGPILAGYQSTVEPGGQNYSPTGITAGSAAAPMYSYYTLQDAGTYVSNLSTTAPEIRSALKGVDVWGYTTAGVGIVSTGGSTGGFASTAGTSVFMYITQTSAQLVTSSAGTTGPSMNKGAALVWDAARFKLCVFSTITGEWLGLAVATST